MRLTDRAIQRRQQKLADKSAQKMGNAQLILTKATQHHGAGQFDEAETLYKKILRTVPRHFEVLNLLGVLFLQTGKPDSAVELISKATDINPDVPESHNNLGLALQGVGRAEDALGSFQKALDIMPDYPDAQMNLGTALHELGRLDAAVESYQKAVAIHPVFPEAHNNLGYALHELGQYEEAAANFQKALAIIPDYAEAHSNLGLALFELGRSDEAEACYHKALAINPEHAKTHNNLGQVLHDLWRLDEAVASFQKARSLLPDIPKVYCNLGQALKDLGSIEEALDSFQTALDLDPEDAEIHFERGTVLQEVGRLEEAAESFRQALRLMPNYGEAGRLLAGTKKFVEDDPDLKILEKSYAVPELGGEQKMNLCFDLGKAFEDLRQYDKAFDFFLAGNILKRTTINFSIKDVKKHVDLLKQAFTQDLFARNAEADVFGEKLIFILGMPRSGTTLIEQILSSHPDVEGIGEVDYLHQVVCTHFDKQNNDQFPDKVGRAGPEQFSKAAQDYLGLIKRHTDTQGFVVDKTLGNFMNIGFLKLMLPKAKIVHCLRSPQDTCLSIFKNLFVADSIPYAYDLSELGAYHNLYLDLMAHWHAVLPDFIYHIQYEDMVADQEKQSKDLLAFCGLDWDDACLEFFNTRRQVKTLSLAQVRQPIYKGSVQAWKKYDKHLTPLLEALN